MEKLPGLAKAGKYDEALNLVRPYAEKGNAEAQFTMAIGLVEKGGETNNSQIVWWARKAATQDYPQALGFLANAYQWGEYGLPTNNVMSAMWSSSETNAAMITKCLDYERDELKVAH
jgi:TPR repeat protein